MSHIDLSMAYALDRSLSIFPETFFWICSAADGLRRKTNLDAIVTDSTGSIPGPPRRLTPSTASVVLSRSLLTSWAKSSGPIQLQIGDE